MIAKGMFRSRAREGEPGFREARVRAGERPEAIAEGPDWLRALWSLGPSGRHRLRRYRASARVAGLGSNGRHGVEFRGVRASRPRGWLRRLRRLGPSDRHRRLAVPRCRPAARASARTEVRIGPSGHTPI